MLFLVLLFGIFPLALVGLVAWAMRKLTHRSTKFMPWWGIVVGVLVAVWLTLIPESLGVLATSTVVPVALIALAVGWRAFSSADLTDGLCESWGLAAASVVGLSVILGILRVVSPPVDDSSLDGVVLVYFWLWAFSPGTALGLLVGLLAARGRAAQH